MTAVPRLACAACGWSPGPPEVDPYPFRCANAGTDDGDHVMTAGQGLGLAESALECGSRSSAGPPERADDTDSPNPFIRYRSTFYSWHVARSRGLSDAAYISIVEEVDAAVAAVSGTSFRITPFTRAAPLGDALGFDRARSAGVWVKDETGNVSGSHKARHLMGVALYLEVLRRLGIERGERRPLAVASCGNAALAAAVVARAIDRPLLVFVPDHAAPSIVERLETLGASVARCRRVPGERGDPSYAAFRRAVADGALPFSCQGNENGLAIEGAMTIAYEMVDRAPAALDRVFVQVGGGALASACVQGLGRCVRTGRLAALPRIHAVQTCGGYPVSRAYDRVADDLVMRLQGQGTRATASSPAERAGLLLETASAAALDEAFAAARASRSRFMWPWETEPHSIAGGILDDETYDWAQVVEGMVRSGGFPLVVDEATLEESNNLARETTGIDVDHTGSSGLAGLVGLGRTRDAPRPGERVAVLFTGGRREG